MCPEVVGLVTQSHDSIMEGLCLGHVPCASLQLDATIDAMVVWWLGAPGPLLLVYTTRGLSYFLPSACGNLNLHWHLLWMLRCI